MKRSAAKCMRVETPELELPMFENSYRFANAMSRTPRGQGSSKMNMTKTFMMMKMFSEMIDSGNGIQKRAADEDVYDLGSKLHEKLELKMEWDEWKNKIEDDWLRTQLEKYCDQCVEFAE